VNMDDGRLLERFIAHREAAFEALLRLHGPAKSRDRSLAAASRFHIRLN
jgi:hypothetical protein